MRCPACSKGLTCDERGSPHQSPLALLLYLVGAVASAVWIAALVAWSPVFIYPKGIGGVALCAAIYLGPGFVIGWYASSRPRVRTLSCSGCGHRASIEAWRGK